MIKAVVIGLAATAAAIAGEVGTDKVLAFREARWLRRPPIDRGAQDARSTSPASRTARSRATR